ncbi:glycoside hydrolase family 16 protein [Mixia osmundae IAM 14324]|uniref:GH16 domain-containing protein n=1 Tax=Mixia osmundae (strain CBS 9802 / IAM 14324 / JCM 22182 / KY 12970) TaxID=764103 RepID=G7DUT0_MIXOS|nr:glycoside hydrolase family 16 protein [Mixia osmundae IAM 14324]KEI37442.1 glycoside hydrolase family 16 protein [Mixia osmundae IAM 14324]GAA94340.1 hypothetical protein E5Q_00991 [Mixia osmundae IAM 14324]
MRAALCLALCITLAASHVCAMSAQAKHLRRTSVQAHMSKRAHKAASHHAASKAKKSANKTSKKKKKVTKKKPMPKTTKHKPTPAKTASVKHTTTMTSKVETPSTVKFTSTSTHTTTTTTSTTATSTSTVVQRYALNQTWAGKNFFDDWDFFSDADPTHGIVNFLNESAAFDAGLAYINSAGNPVLQVDANTTLPLGVGRNSVRIMSKTGFERGLLIFDALKMPYGCGTWPAFWLLGDPTYPWPTQGEIDIVEGVNLNTVNQMTIHTSDGCTLQTPMKATGNIVAVTDCNALENDNTGCGVQDTRTSSYGAPFAQAGGGVFATLIDDSGIAVWFFTRKAVPADITSGKPTPSKWGLPAAYYNSSTCPLDTFFGPQYMIYDITLGGDWAGGAYPWSGCPGNITSCVADPTNFENAIFETKSIKLYTLTS